MAFGIDGLDRSESVHLHNWIPSIFFTRVDIAKEILSSIATSLLTMTTITFSVMMVVLSTYASQYSPRVLPNFTKSLTMQHAQGIFFAGFVFSVTSLLLLKRLSDDRLVPEAAASVILAILCLVFFIYFIHRVSQSIQVNHLISDIGTHARKMIRSINVGNHDTGFTSMTIHQLKAPKEGYLRSIDYIKWMKFCKKEKGQVRVIPRIGQYINKGEMLLECRSQSVPYSFGRWVDIGPTRTNEQDLEFVMEKIIEMALRAISPSVNDPNTAIYCIRELSVLLEEISKWEGSAYWVYPDSEGVGRVYTPIPSFEEMLYKFFYQIRHYGASDISVSAALIDALIRISSNKSLEIQQAVWSVGGYVIHNISEKAIHILDREYLQKKWEKLAFACNQQPTELFINGQKKNENG